MQTLGMLIYFFGSLLGIYDIFLPEANNAVLFEKSFFGRFFSLAMIVGGIFFYLGFKKKP